MFTVQDRRKEEKRCILYICVIIFIEMISWEMCPNPFTGMSGLILKCYISQSTKVSGSAELAPRMKVKLKLMTYI